MKRSTKIYAKAARPKRKYPAIDANYKADGYSKLTRQFWDNKRATPSECITIFKAEKDPA